jgi:hypothetical protein
MIWQYRLAECSKGWAAISTVAATCVVTPCSHLFPVGQCHQFVEDFLQSLKPTFLIPRCAGFVLPTLQVQAVRFTDFGYFAP